MARSLLGWDVASVAAPQNWRHYECSVLQRADKECEIDVRSTRLADQTRDEGVLRRECASPRPTPRSASRPRLLPCASQYPRLSTPPPASHALAHSMQYPR